MLFKLQRDLPNPGYDKRCRYGVRGLAGFKVELVFYVSDKGWGQLMDRHGFIADRELVAKLKENAAPYTATNLAEAILATGHSPYALSASYMNDVVGQLLAGGKIAMDDVIAACAAAWEE